MLKVHRRHHSRYKVLASADEIGLYVADEFNALADAHPFYQHRIGPDSNASLLGGTPCLEGLHSTAEKPLRIDSRLFYL